MMIKTSVLGLVTLGLCAAACSGSEDHSESVGPPLTAEEIAVTAKMEQQTLAHIDLPQGKLRFIETEPGLVLIMRSFPVGAAAPHVDGEDEMTLDQIFRAYAPDREVPQAIFDAMSRGAAVARDAAPEPAELADEAPQTFQGQLPASAAEVRDGDFVTRSSALTDADFLRKCSYSNVSWSWCRADAGTGAWAQHAIHRGDSLTCGTHGSARTQFFVSGALTVSINVPFGECWSTGTYHGPHGAFGTNLNRTLKWVVAFADSTVGFTGWTKGNDDFVIIGWRF